MDTDGRRSDAPRPERRRERFDWKGRATALSRELELAISMFGRGKSPDAVVVDRWRRLAGIGTGR